MGLKGYRLWVMGQLDSNVQSPTGSQCRHHIPLEVDHARAALHHQPDEGGLLPLPDDLPAGRDAHQAHALRQLGDLPIAEPSAQRHKFDPFEKQISETRISHVRFKGWVTTHQALFQAMVGQLDSRV
jgi:hypothetical protein